jgi:hypothetical protein
LKPVELFEALPSLGNGDDEFSEAWTIRSS